MYPLGTGFGGQQGTYLGGGVNKIIDAPKMHGEKNTNFSLLAGYPIMTQYIFYIFPPLLSFGEFSKLVQSLTVFFLRQHFIQIQWNNK